MTQTLTAGSFYGEVGRRLEAADAILSVVRHRCACALPEHEHERPYFCLLIDGDYKERVGSRTLVYEPFTIAYHPPRLPHVDAVGARGGCFFLVELGEGWLDWLPAGGRSYSFELDGGALVWPALRLFQEVARGGADPPLVESLIFEACGHLGAARAAERVQPAWVGRAAEQIREAFDAPIDLRGLARDARVHPAHFAKTYRRFRGRSVGEDVQYQRVRHACRRLSAGEPIADVALGCGFADQSHLTRVFRRVTGVTPAALRARLQAGRGLGTNSR